MKWFQKTFSKFSNDIAIDLGTANTLVYLHGQGIVIDEPSIVAINRKTGRVVAVGTDAKSMQGRAPNHIEVVRPLVDGVISDFEVTEEMLHYLITKADKMTRRTIQLGPRVIVGVPSGITNVEIQAVIDAAKNSGAREVYIIEEPMAAAIGIGLHVHEPQGCMVIDIGGGTTDIAAISLGGIVQSKKLTVAGDHLNQAITDYLRQEFKVLVGERTAEDVKTVLGAVILGDAREMTIRGRDLISGLPREIIVTDSDIRHAITPAITSIVAGAREILEGTPPEILADIMRRGIYVTGGGAMFFGLADLLAAELTVPVYVAEEPLTAVVRGAGIVFDDIERYRDVLISEHDELPPR